MKKLIISAICLLALAAGVSSYAYYHSHQIVAKNELAKANVEALTEDEPIDGGELPEGEITCSGSGHGKCYEVDWDEGLYGYCLFKCSLTGNPDDNCASWWIDLVNFCTFYGGFNSVGNYEL